MIYILIFIFFSFISLLELNVESRALKINLALLYIICGIFLIVMAGTRIIGFDYDNYERLYEEVNLHNYIENAIEIGYAFLTTVSKSIGLSFHQFCFLLALVTVTMKMYFCYRWSDNWFLALTYYFVIGFTINDMGQIRHGLAIGIVLIAFSDLFKENYRGFFIKTLIAFFIHASAIIVFPVYFLVKSKISETRLMLWVIPFFLFVFIDLKQILALIVDYLPLSQIQIKVSYYVLSEEVGKRLGLNISLILRLIFLLLLYRYRETGKKRYPYFETLFRLYYFGVMIYIVFNSIDGVAIRSSLYFKTLEVIIIPIIVKLGRHKLEQNVIWVLMILYSFWSLYKLLYDPETAPAFLPYKTYLFSL